MIKEHEGLRTKVYLDPVGIPTVCYGHTGPEVKLGQVYTKAQCEALLHKDIRVHRAGLAQCIRHPLNNNQADAVTSFAFNVGVTKVCKSTMARKINAGDLSGAAREFPKWKYAKVGGRNVVLRGLEKRRAAEQGLFLTAPYNESLVQRFQRLVAFS